MTSSAGLSGNQKRKMKSASRLYAVQALFQMEHSSQSFDTVRKEFLEHRFGATYDGQEMIGNIANIDCCDHLRSCKFGVIVFFSDAASY